LTVSGVVYDRRVGEQTLSFGVSGRLYNSNLLLYDRQTESLWSQITAEAVAGWMTGAKLNTVPFAITTWQQWQQQHPHSLVLGGRSTPAFFSELGKALQAVIPPWGRSPQTTSPQSQTPLAEMVLGVTVGEEKKAYPLDELMRTASPFLIDQLGGEEVRLFFTPQSAFAYAENSRGERLASLMTYRATWFAFPPHSQLYSAPR